MANIDAPRGFVPVKNAGKVIRTSDYIKTAAAVIFQGDLVKRVAAGTVEAYAPGDTEPVIGVSAVYSPATSTDPVAVYDDPEQIFKAQTDTDTAFASADIGLNADAEADHAGSTATGLSGQEVDMSTALATATLPLKVLGLAAPINQEENADGVNADILVKINRHEQGNLQTGV